jgi:hypothetical protein
MLRRLLPSRSKTRCPQVGEAARLAHGRVGRTTYDRGTGSWPSRYCRPRSGLHPRREVAPDRSLSVHMIVLSGALRGSSRLRPIRIPSRRESRPSPVERLYQSIAPDCKLHWLANGVGSASVPGRTAHMAVGSRASLRRAHPLSGRGMSGAGLPPKSPDNEGLYKSGARCRVIQDVGGSDPAPC